MLKQSLLLTAALSLPTAALAQNLSYDYLEGGYQKSTQRFGDEDDIDADGYFASGSLLIQPKVYLQATYDAATTDKVAGSFAEFDVYRAGAGFRHPLTDRLDLNLGGGAIFAKVEPRGPIAQFADSDDDTGYYLNSGLRAKVLPALEVNGGFEYSKVFDESETTARVGGVFNFTPAFAAVGEYAYGDDLNTYRLGARWNFR